MFDQFLKTYKVIGKDNRIKAFWLLTILLSIIILELLNFTLIIPILTILFDKESVENIKFITYLDNFFGADINSLIKLAIIFLVLLIFKVLLLLFFEYKTQKYNRQINVDMTIRAYSYFLNSPWEEILKIEHAYIMRIILSDIGTFVSEGILKFIEIIKNSIFLTFILGYLLFFNLKITLIIMGVFIFFTVTIFMIFKKKLLQLSLTTAEFDKYRYKHISESIMNLRDIKLIKNANFFLNTYKKNEEKYTKVYITSKILAKIPRFVLEIILVTFAVFIAIFFELQNLEMNNYIPILGLYSFAILRLIPIFTVYNQSFQAIRQAKIQIHEAILNAERFIKIFDQNKLKEKNKNLINIDFKNDVKIKILDVDFYYDATKPIFNDLNLEINKDNTIYLEGVNGSGKSTFVDLISGLLSPIKGKIKINDFDLSEISDNWLKNVGYVSQTNFLLNSTIKENIIFGRDSINEKDINEVIKIVGLDKLIDSLPDGLNTNVGNLGSSFSGGQKQRISIARALVAKPNIIILDEATNALDAATEEHFLNIINTIKKNRIILFIAHSKVIKNFCDIRIEIKNKKIEKIK